MDMSNDRQRARSLSSVPDLHTSHETIAIPTTGASFDVSTGASPETDSSSAEDTAGTLGTAASSIALGRVYAAHSLPSHIWSLNGEKMYRLFTRERKKFLLPTMNVIWFIMTENFQSNFNFEGYGKLTGGI
ncbi:hypothetical protein GEV33_006561 [Tenebrio molitor]|uniref:Uncharacterized protein n=1 Tax=Tenebrio molitor TaxID=7067 RepID=A0A8J6LD40_TENMO|nr:hypothetical protein GEV33_006561 [Tenebrio molitor]